MSNLASTFADRLRNEMDRAGMTGAELARRSGLHFVSISRILNGHITPTLLTCELLAKSLDIAPEKLFRKNR